MTNDLRPGVFSAYTVVSGAPARRSEQYAAICAVAQGGEAGKVYRFTRVSELGGVFLGGNALLGAKLLLESGVTQVLCVAASVDGAAPGDDAYTRAFSAVEELDNIGAVVCDSPRQSVQALLLASVARSCETLRERVGIATADTADATEAVSKAEAAAKALNSERMCLCHPECTYDFTTSGFVTACAFAGAMLVSEPGAPLFGLALHKSVVLNGANLPESDVQRLLRAGAAVFETSGGGVECVRAVTTKTTTNGEPDATFRNLSTVRIIDTILGRARAALKALLRGAGGRGASLSTIVSQMTVLLAEAKDEGLVTAFETPKAARDGDDPAICVVELGFEAATSINQIHIMAHISV